MHLCPAAFTIRLGRRLSRWRSVKERRLRHVLGPAQCHQEAMKLGLTLIVVVFSVCLEPFPDGAVKHRLHRPSGVMPIHLGKHRVSRKGDAFGGDAALFMYTEP